jgi:peroxiredoxin
MRIPRPVRAIGILLAIAMGFAAGVVLNTRAADGPATQPTEGQGRAAQANAGPTTAPSLSPAVAASIKQIHDAYLALQSLSQSGTIEAKSDSANGPKSFHNDFTAIFHAPGKFRQEMKGDVVMGNTGEKAFVLLVDDNKYIQVDGSKDKVELSAIPGGRVLHTQNLSLAMAISPDPSATLLLGVTAVNSTNDVNIGGKNYPALALTYDTRDVTIAVDPDTHLLRRVTIDETRGFKEQDPSFKSATATIDYATTNVNSSVTDEQLAWAPPTGAQEMKPDAGGGGEVPDLAGKPAPAFAIKGMDGVEVSNNSIRGSVTILDFWATWCGPCRAALPGLNKIYDDNKAAGLKVFAVNVQEEKDDVNKFINETKLTIPVLLDSEGKAGQAYGADAIPETVVIGKDGTVRKVFVGAGNEENIAAEVAAAMKVN